MKRHKAPPFCLGSFPENNPTTEPRHLSQAGNWPRKCMHVIRIIPLFPLFSSASWPRTDSGILRLQDTRQSRVRWLKKHPISRREMIDGGTLRVVRLQASAAQSRSQLLVSNLAQHSVKADLREVVSCRQGACCHAAAVMQYSYKVLEQPVTQRRHVGEMAPLSALNSKTGHPD